MSNNYYEIAVIQPYLGGGLPLANAAAHVIYKPERMKFDVLCSVKNAWLTHADIN
jgi:hypothetical protein